MSAPPAAAIPDLPAAVPLEEVPPRDQFLRILGTTDAGAANQLRIIMEGLATRAVRFHTENKMGIYRKAKLANVFKWRLKEAGYSEDFIEKVTKDLVTRLAVK